MGLSASGPPDLPFQPILDADEREPLPMSDTAEAGAWDPGAEASPYFHLLTVIKHFLCT